MDNLLNGDLSEDHVVHHCRPGCCSSRAQTIKKFKLFFVPALAGHIHPFSRSKWTGAEETQSKILALESMHRLFSRTFKRLAMLKSPEVVAAAEEEEDASAAALDVLPSNATSDDHFRQDKAAVDASPSEWHLQYSRWLGRALAWMEEDCLYELVAFRAVMCARRQGLHRMFRTASTSWGRRQQLREH
eukprot:9455254-Pyramimonas_sp.AAC.1